MGTVAQRIREGHRGIGSGEVVAFDLPVEPAYPMILIVTYTNDEQQRRTFDVLVEGRKIGERTIERRTPEKDVRFFDIEYALPADFTTTAAARITCSAPAQSRMGRTNGVGATNAKVSIMLG